MTSSLCLEISASSASNGPENSSRCTAKPMGCSSCTAAAVTWPR